VIGAPIISLRNPDGSEVLASGPFSAIVVGVGDCGAGTYVFW
jgi:hypothetical protein